MLPSVSINRPLNSYTDCVIRHLRHDGEFFGLNLDRKERFPPNTITLIMAL
ncbi:hypothetical protein F907_03401 [Acinetobacter colistiniresistens]|uniref:Uncharacterized protein n=1 Tax=Acinetobacter colistiniresistens TaxID=280145 RepID=S3T3V6_9GAMM|nr:hypothetical protein [Acinetobacter colistiniresistens]EPG34484.1 hypothetical protein F907_03401 [Acinetobacter colistiniresistens]